MACRAVARTQGRACPCRFATGRVGIRGQYALVNHFGDPRLTTRHPAPAAHSPLAAAADMLAGAMHVLVFAAVALDDAEPAGPPRHGMHGFWRRHAQPGGWRAPVKTSERTASQWARRQVAAEAQRQPGAGHHAAVSLQRTLTTCEIVTPSTDILLEIAGARHVRHLNGHVPGERCELCGALQVAGTVSVHGHRHPAQTALWPCRHCAGAMQPWPARDASAVARTHWSHALRAVRGCEAMLWLTGQDFVYPSAEFAHLAVAHGAKLVLASRAPTALDHLADICLRDTPAGAVAALAERVRARRCG